MSIEPLVPTRGSASGRAPYDPSQPDDRRRDGAPTVSERIASDRTVSEPTVRTPSSSTASVHPTPTDEEAVAIVAAMEALWPKPVVAVAAPTSRDRSWKFSGRWWARPVAVRRDRPWR